MVDEITLNEFYLLIAGTIATEGSFSLYLHHETDKETRYDNLQTISACCEYLSSTGYLRWFLKPMGNMHYFVCQADDVWNIRKEK